MYIQDTDLEEKGYKDKRRWLVLFAFSLFSFANQSCFTTFAPVLDAASKYYNTSSKYIIWLSNIWFISYTIAGILAIKPLMWRLDLPIIAATFTTCLGGWIRYVGGNDYWITFFGTLLIALSQIFVLPVPAILSERWFTNEERVVANGIGFFSSISGFSLGFLISCFYIGNDSKKVESFLLYQAIFLSLPVIFSLLFIRNSPKYPANNTSSSEKLDLFPSLKVILMKTNNFLGILCCSIYLGVSWAFLSSLDYILEPKGYNSTNIGIIGIIMAATGIISGLMATIYIDNQLSKNEVPAYDFFIKIFSIISLVSLGIVSLILLYMANISKVFTYISTGIIGIGLNAFAPIATQSLIETYFPAHEVTTFTMFNLIANIIGFLTTELLTLNSIGQYGLIILSILMIPITIYLLFYYKTILNRLQVEKQGQQ